MVLAPLPKMDELEKGSQIPVFEGCLPNRCHTHKGRAALRLNAGTARPPPIQGSTWGFKGLWTEQRELQDA